MPVRPTDVILIDFDNTLVNAHLSNMLAKVFDPDTMGRIDYSLRVYDCNNDFDETHIPLMIHAQSLVSSGEVVFNNEITAKILEALETENQRIAIVTFSAFPDIIYELIVKELSRHNIPLFYIYEKLKVVGGFPYEGQDSPNRKQEHATQAFLAFEAIQEEITINNVLELFKGVTMIDDSLPNIWQALACRMNAILVRSDGTLDENPTQGPCPTLHRFHLIPPATQEPEEKDDASPGKSDTSDESHIPEATQEPEKKDDASPGNESASDLSGVTAVYSSPDVE